MAFYAIYDDDGIILKTVECPPFLINQIAKTTGGNIIEIDRVADDKTELIINNQLVKKLKAAE